MRSPRALAALLALVAALALAAGCGGGDAPGAPGGTELSGAGLAMTIPAGWEGRITAPPELDGGGVIQAGTVPLADPAESTFGFGAVEEIPPGDVYLALVETRPFVPVPEGEDGSDLAIAPADLLPDAVPGPFPAAAGGAQRLVTREGRTLNLLVVVGDRSDATALLEPVNAALATLTVEPAP